MNTYSTMKRVGLLVIGMLALNSNAADHWNQFRGPNGAGSGSGFSPPVELAESKIAWNVNVPEGMASPVIWENQLYVVGLEEGRFKTVALSSGKGALLWELKLPEVTLGKVHRAGHQVASTPCADEKGIYVYFGPFGMVSYDHSGKERWRKRLPLPKSMYGMSTSPIVRDGRVYLVLDDDTNLEGSRLSRSRVICLNAGTGEMIWETARPYNRSGWSTPVIWDAAEKSELIVLGNGRAYGYDLKSGEERWYVNGFSRETIAVPVIGDGRVYLSVSRQGGWGEEEIDPVPFWISVLPFDQDGDGRIGKNEIGKDFTVPFRPELPIGHPGFGFPLPDDPAKRKERQLKLFQWRDKNGDGFWTREEFISDMQVGRGRPNLSAVKPGGLGDVTETHVDWTLRSGIPEIPSPLFYEGHLYLLRAGGLLTCVDADTGKVIYKERLDAPGHYSASPVAAGGRLYLTSSTGVVTVVKAGKEFEKVHQMDLATEINATPAMDGDSFYVRTKTGLTAFR